MMGDTKWEAQCLTDEVSKKVCVLIDKMSKNKRASLITALKAILEILKKS